MNGDTVGSGYRVYVEFCVLIWFGFFVFTLCCASVALAAVVAAAAAAVATTITSVLCHLLKKKQFCK